MTSIELFHWLAHTPALTALRAADHHVIEVVEIFHVVGLVLLLTAIVLVNLRLLGWVLPGQPLTEVARTARPILHIGLTLAVVTGTTIFLSALLKYNDNAAFWPKIVLLFLALLVQFTLQRSVTKTDTPNPVLAKTTALLSLSLWFSVGLAGRAIGFV